jgi:hypothetical protein
MWLDIRAKLERDTELIDPSHGAVVHGNLRRLVAIDDALQPTLQ